MVDVTDDRYSRHLGLIGADGQRRLQAQRAAVAGLGGLGSHVAQLLAFLGVANYILIDGDVVETSNLNRLIGATPDDARSSTPKVQVASRMIRSIQPDAAIQAFQTPLQELDLPALFGSVDVVFGCVDNDSARLILVEITSRNDLLFLDLASDAGEQDGFLWYGGRILVADGRVCLSCADLLDQRELALASMTPEQREADQRIYGVDRGQLDEAGPSVVSINGVVANLAVTEYMVAATGLRAPIPHLRYRGWEGIVVQSTDPREVSCYYCEKLRKPASRGQR